MNQITPKTITAIKSLNLDEGNSVEAVLCDSAFTLVCDPRDWRSRIDTVVDLRHTNFSAEFVAYAIAFMTSTIATVTELSDGRTRFQATGYRMGPAGP